MTAYTIRPMLVGQVRTSKGVITHLVDTMIPLIAPVLTFYIEGGAKKILVDAGVQSGGRDGHEGMMAALAEIGLQPADIDVVILTHLHFDHVENIGLFPHAQFIVQKREWDYAKSPLPAQKGIYPTEVIEQLEKYDLLLVDDGFEVAEGVRVICVPGHTKGQQAVAVKTADGTYVIAGDLLYSYLNIYPERTELADAFGNIIHCTPLPGHDFYPPGIHTDLRDWYASVQRVLEIAGSRTHIIPGHDPAVIGRVFPEK